MTFRLTAVNRVDVQGRLARFARHHRHRGLPGRELGQEVPLDAVEECAHVADRAFAEERHRAVRDPPERFDLRPPHAAVAEADPIDPERLGDDHVIDLRP
jgi:hypothetical protein